VHRDIKLENILIDVNNNIKICDFGIGKILSSKDELLYDQCGTPMYIAPEIFLSSKKKGYKGPPVDIWSSGIALYIMLSGSLPFDINQYYVDNLLDKDISSDEEEKKHNIILQKVIINSEPKKIEKISKEAKNLLAGLLNKNPDKRLTIDEILNHPWLKETGSKIEKNKKHHHLFTKAELLIMSKTYIDYRKADIEDLIENFTISNLIKNESNKNINKNITTKSSILAPYNTLIQNEENDSYSEEYKNDLFDDFNNKKILLEDNEIIGFNPKPKECNMLYELNNNGEVDNGMLINSKTNSNTISSNTSHYSNIAIRNSFRENNDEDEVLNIHDIIDNEEKVEKKKEKVYAQMKLMGYERDYVKKCVEDNVLCHACVVYFLLMNYDN
jgi:serine/threonine protein kinase